LFNELSTRSFIYFVVQTLINWINTQIRNLWSDNVRRTHSASLQIQIKPQKLPQSHQRPVLSKHPVSFQK
jgi:hypothetical protein